MTLHIRRYAQPGKSSVGGQNGQENSEEVQEDPGDQAVDEIFLQVVAWVEARTRWSKGGVRHGSRLRLWKGCRRKAGGPFHLQMPADLMQLA
jgi:hypothetical protein